MHASCLLTTWIDQSDTFFTAMQGPRGDLAAEGAFVNILRRRRLISVFLPFSSLLLLELFPVILQLRVELTIVFSLLEAFSARRIVVRPIPNFFDALVEAVAALHAGRAHHAERLTSLRVISELCTETSPHHLLIDAYIVELVVIFLAVNLETFRSSIFNLFDRIRKPI